MKINWRTCNILTTQLAIVLLICCLLTRANAQWVEGSLFGNEWIDLSKPMVRIQVTKPGIQRVNVSDLPEGFPKKAPGQYQLWYRGKEVTIIKANDSEILFYGLLNDGASDSLVFRPYSARLNPYISLYSDTGAYFLTYSDAPKRAGSVEASGSPGDETKSVAYHVKTLVKTYTDQFSFATFSISTLLNNSYYEEANSWTGPTIAGSRSTTDSVKDTLMSVSLSLDGWIKTDAFKPGIELLFHGLNSGAHKLKIEVSPDNSKWRSLQEVSFSGWTGKKAKFQLENSDIADNGKIYFRIYSPTSVGNDWFSLTYCAIEYPQRIAFFNKETQEITIPEIRDEKSVRIYEADETTEVFDITDYNLIRKVSGKRPGDNSIVLSTGQMGRQSLRLLVTGPSRYSTVSRQNISLCHLSPVYTYNRSTSAGIPSPKEYDYIMIATSKLMDAAVKYAEYRSSEQGGGHKVLLMNIRDLYDLFNFGEPSPVAIRSFIKYMLKDGVRPDRHNLLLIGPSVTSPRYFLKEMVDEVPAIGDPGSDLLLVSGIAGYNRDTPAIPVGRLRAADNNELSAYLDKVRSYEHEDKSISWRKQIMHLSGGKTTQEISLLKSVMEGLTPFVESSSLGGSVESITKKTTFPTEGVNITPQVNRGIGLLSFFGHGALEVTDLYFGYATDVSRAYNNENRYPLMYFNGCGVGNIFTSRVKHYLSDDWVFAPKKGAIAVVANSYDSYITSSTKHINAFYDVFFNSAQTLTIGQIWKNTAEKIIKESPSAYDIANTHQICLQGDPALKLIRVEEPDYLLTPNESILLYSADGNKPLKDSDKGKIALLLQNGGKFVSGQSIPVKISLTYDNGSSKILNILANSVKYMDTVWVDVENANKITRIVATIDPETVLTEFTRVNNSSDLPIDWAEVEDTYTYYPGVPLRDAIAPRVNMLIDKHPASEKAKASPNSRLDFILEDDRVLSEETNNIEVYYRKCWDDNCAFTPLSIASMSSESLSETALVLSYQMDGWESGEYEVMVVGYDRSGNATSGKILYRFRIADESTESPAAVVVTPNPASSYAKFTISDRTTVANYIENITWKVYSAAGQLIKEEKLDKSQVVPEWYFYFSPGLPGGIYYYEVQILYSNRESLRKTGKLIKQ